MNGLTQAVQDVLRERARQIENKGYDHEHDDGHDGHEIAAAAAYYAMPPGAREWPATETGYGDTFGEAIAPENWTMKDYGDRRRELVVAAALLVAEIERMDRAAGGVMVDAEAAYKHDRAYTDGMVFARQCIGAPTTMERADEALRNLDAVIQRRHAQEAEYRAERRAPGVAAAGDVPADLRAVLEKHFGKGAHLAGNRAEALDYVLLRAAGVSHLDGECFSRQTPMVSGDSEANKEKGNG